MRPEPASRPSPTARLRPLRGVLSRHATSPAPAGRESEWTPGARSGHPPVRLRVSSSDPEDARRCPHVVRPSVPPFLGPWGPARVALSEGRIVLPPCARQVGGPPLPSATLDAASIVAALEDQGVVPPSTRGLRVCWLGHLHRFEVCGRRGSENRQERPSRGSPCRVATLSATAEATRAPRAAGRAARAGASSPSYNRLGRAVRTKRPESPR